MHALFLLLALGLNQLFQPVAAITNYANEFVDPQFLLNQSYWNAPAEVTTEIVAGAVYLAAQGPWTVTNKTILPPSNDTKDYLSWPPYAWPDCSKVGNTTALTDEQIWTECPYVTRDGQFNPDQHLVNNTGAFYGLSDAVFYNAIAWRINGSSTFAANVVSIINAWFLDPTTAMNPNLNYAQLLRGPGKQLGQHTGVLDLKCMAKIASAVLTLRLGNSPEWTSAVDEGFKDWVSKYITWLTTSSLGLGEKAATNNHGSFYYNQLAALYLIVDDKENAKATVQEFFSGLYQAQIIGNGDQPFESARTHPYHYRAYNLAAIITNARIGQYVGFDAWHINTTKGGSIEGAANYAMGISANSSGEAGAAVELFPVVAAVAAVYGDPTGKYATFLKSADPKEPFFFWDLPTQSGIVNGTETASLPAHTATSSGVGPSGTPHSGNKNGAIGRSTASIWAAGFGAVAVLASFTF